MRVLALHRAELLLVGLRAVLAQQPWVERCIGTPDAGHLVDLARRYEPHVVLIHTGDERGARSVADAVRGVCPSAGIVVVCDGWRMAPPTLRAIGALSAVSTDLAAADWPVLVRRAASGQPPDQLPACARHTTLTGREHEVLTAAARGATNREIARDLSISTDTVKDHLSRLYRKLDVRNRAQAVGTARAMGLLGEPPS